MYRYNILLSLPAVLSGSAPPGNVWLLQDQSTVLFTSDEYNNLPGFRATYKAAKTSDLSGKVITLKGDILYHQVRV